jgi:SAM-dependent methyltransferase
MTAIGILSASSELKTTDHHTSVNFETKESQYQRCLDVAQKERTELGLMTNQAWHDDPKHLVFTLSRYKFVSKMLAGRDRVLEVGCADAWGTRLVVQTVNELTAVDFDPVFVEDVNTRMEEKWKFDCIVHDMLAGPVPGQFDAAYALDVIEHIPTDDENAFVGNMAGSLNAHGIMILGSPSIQSQVHASRLSKEGHVNCKDAPGLRSLLERFFHTVFIFSMNDEVVHTGYHPMAQYLMGVACDRKTL